MQNFKPWNNHIFSPSEINILTDTNIFFSNNINHLNTFINIISGESNISCRLLYWFVTKFYLIDNNFSHIHDSYQNHIKQHSSIFFNPFCCKHKLIYYTNVGPHINTSIGQLHFFKWALLNNVISDLQNNFHNIKNNYYQ